eukprot:gnl/TRDRNA2_/TRDRNA2_159431_c1_seq1.p1 gnl/TRDRNA2_/TRDRNA2_159431_c1~~gnl/TRDRNA2_/TRDRNA2_159431_c1_seq1.p1  ORF type:complete len:125 (-),score=0.55 gnl/TRDRNA2_/TRDRNA2_159431_c1_seq1:275-649(-)
MPHSYVLDLRGHSDSQMPPALLAALVRRHRVTDHERQGFPPELPAALDQLGQLTGYRFNRLRGPANRDRSINSVSTTCPDSTTPRSSLTSLPSITEETLLHEQSDPPRMGILCCLVNCWGCFSN